MHPLSGWQICCRGGVALHPLCCRDYSSAAWHPGCGWPLDSWERLLGVHGRRRRGQTVWLPIMQARTVSRTGSGCLFQVRTYDCKAIVILLYYTNNVQPMICKGVQEASFRYTGTPTSALRALPARPQSHLAPPNVLALHANAP